MPTYRVPIIPTRTASAAAKGSVPWPNRVAGWLESDMGVEWVTFDAETNREAEEVLAWVWWREDNRSIRGTRNVRHYVMTEEQVEESLGVGFVRIYTGSDQ